jgi:hypothetical protein
VSIGPERIGENESVPPVVLGTTHRVAIPESVDLLGIDGENGDAALEEGFDNGAMRFLNRHGDALGVFPGEAQEPSEGRGESLGTMPEASLLHELSVRIEDAGLVKRMAQVDPDE